MESLYNNIRMEMFNEVSVGMLTIYIYPSAPVVRDSESGVLQLFGFLIY